MKKSLVFLMLTLVLGVCQLGTPNVYGQSIAQIELTNSLKSKPAPRKPAPKPAPRRPAPAPRRGHYKPDFHNRERMRQDSRAVLNRTATVIREAQLAARKNGYAHGLSKAFAHQDYARKLHMRGEYREAIFHSMRARNIAYDIIEKNRFSRRPEHDWDDVDYGYMPYAPKDNELDVKIKSDKSDNDYIYISIKLDLD